MNELKLFKNKEFGELRTAEKDGKVLFCGSDVAKALGYADTAKAIKSHCKEDGWAICPVIDNMGREQQAKFITEGNVYRLITHSKLEKAEQFEKWVFDDVLPTIRKTGGYVNNEDTFVNTYLPFADDRVKALFSQTLGALRKANEKIEADKPKVLFANAVETSKTAILVGDLAKILKQNGVDIGQKRLFDYLRENGYLIKCGSSKNMPTQRAMEMGLFEVKETAITNPDGSIRITRTTKISGKGQQFFINKFLAN